MNIKKTIVCAALSLLLSNTFNSAYSADDEYVVINAGGEASGAASLELSSSVVMSADVLKEEVSRAFSDRFLTFSEPHIFQLYIFQLFLMQLNSVLSGNVEDYQLIKPFSSFDTNEVNSPFLQNCLTINEELSGVLASITDEMLVSDVFQRSLITLVNATGLYALATVDVTFIGVATTYRMSGFISKAIKVLGNVEHSCLRDFANELFVFLGRVDVCNGSGTSNNGVVDRFSELDRARIIFMLAQVPKGILNSDFIKRVSEEYDDSHFGKKPTSSRGTSTPKTVGTIGCVIEKLLQERPKRTLTGWSLFA